jgi:PilZ domain
MNKGKPAPSDASLPASARRKFPRYPVDLRISLQVLRSEGPVSLWGRSNELGADGIGITLTGQLDPGEVVNLELTLPMASSPVKIRALVRYRDGLRHGFEFLALSPKVRDAVNQACESLQAQQ